MPWAEAQANLGDALGLLGERNGEVEYLQKASEAYRNALRVLTPEISLGLHNLVRQNLSRMLAHLAGRQIK